MTLTKRDVSGAFVWQTSFDQQDPTRWERASWVETDSEGNVIVCGTYMSGFSNPVEAASIVMKFDPVGNLLWRNVYETSFDGSYTKKCLIDTRNNIYVLGTGSGPPGYVTKVKKFSPDGTALWSYFDSAGIGLAVNFKFTPDGFITITGRSVFGSVNGYAKINVNGNVVWSYSGVFSLAAGDCDGDAFGNTYLVNGDYITKVGPSGALIWENVYGINGRRVEVGSDNLAVVSGFPNSGAGAAFIKVDENGGLVWSNLDADGPLVLLLHAQMHLDGANNAYLAAGTLFEMAVCKVNCDGSSAWTQTVPGSYSNAMVLGDNDNSVFVVGGTTARISQGLDVVEVPPSDFNLIRGILISGTLENVFSSDDMRMRFNPGFTLNSSEAPVWIIFDANLSTDSPNSLSLQIEAQAGTPGLTATTEAWNWNTSTFDVVDVSATSFNTDTVITPALTPGDHVQSGTAAVHSRLGWRKTGFTINYPWETRLDQFVWIEQ